MTCLVVFRFEIPDPVRAPKYASVSARLKEFGAVEIHVLATQAAPSEGRVLRGGRADEVQHCQMLAFRMRNGKVEEAMPIAVPEPEMRIGRCPLLATSLDA